MLVNPTSRQVFAVAGIRKYLKLGGGASLRGHFFLKKKGTFLKMKRSFLCL